MKRILFIFFLSLIGTMVMAQEQKVDSLIEDLLWSDKDLDQLIQPQKKLPLSVSDDQRQHQHHLRRTRNRQQPTQRFRHVVLFQ
jgi:hypothetical protein